MRTVPSLYPLQRWLRARAGLYDVHGHLVHVRSLDRSSLVIDAGANRGAFTRALRERCDCRVFALEPNPALTWQGEPTDRVEWLQAGLHESLDRASFRISSNPEASTLRLELVPVNQIEEDLEVELLGVEDVMFRAGVNRVDLLKLDIEGSEIEVLQEIPTSVLNAIAQISVEFHSFLGVAEENLSIREVSKRLLDVGFLRLHASAPAVHETDVLFLHPQRCRLSVLTRVHLRFVEPAFASLRRCLGQVRDRVWSDSGSTGPRESK